MSMIGVIDLLGNELLLLQCIRCIATLEENGVKSTNGNWKDVAPALTFDMMCLGTCLEMAEPRTFEKGSMLSH